MNRINFYKNLETLRFYLNFDCDFSNAETSNVSKVLDGDLDLFINAYLKGANLGTLNLK